MAPHGFDRFMVSIHLGSNPKVGRFTDREFRCLVTGVWTLAAESAPRGYLAIAGAAATADDVARRAHCSVATAHATLLRMRSLGMLEADDEMGLEHVHDWEILNPPPKVDRTAAERQRRRRARLGVTPMSHRDSRPNHAGEVEVEVEEEETSTATTSLTEAQALP